MCIKVQVIFYSMYSHVYRMAASENEVQIARYQSKHVAEIAAKLFR
jgi:hypothetical protein